MSIIKLTSENFQNYELVANPRKTFESSSHGATYAARVTGSVALFADTSPSLKDLDPTFGEAEEGFDDINIDQTRVNAYATASADSLEHYLSAVNSHPQGDRQNKRQEVLRFIPGAKPDKNFMSKGVIKNTLFKHYSNAYQNLDWAYTNYNCLHFFRSNDLPNDTALIYPSMTGSEDGVNYYAPSSSFTFDFFLKPKVPKTFETTDEYTAGTILHMSSCYAISLATGSSRGPDGLPDKFRILLQLSQSADIKPSLCVLGESEVTSPSSTDKAWLFASEDNSLKRDHWHHVSITWPGGKVMGSSGSIIIDSKKRKSFIIDSGSCMQSTAPIGLTSDDPNAVFVGNYYEGKNVGASAISRYFAPTVATDQGLTPIDASVFDADPTGVYLEHILNAEVHDIKIYKTYKSMSEIKALGKEGPKTLKSDLLFYVPPYFTQYSRNRLILQTPFFDVTGSSEDPFNVALSFGVGGLEINLENFTREFVKQEYPRLLNMTSSRIDTSATEEGKTSDDLLYKSGSAVRRLYSLLPCDNGYFLPGFNLLETGSGGSPGSVSHTNYSKFIDRFNVVRYDLINLENMVATSSLPVGLSSTEYFPTRSISGVMTRKDGLVSDADVTFGTGSFLFELQGASPEDPSVSPGNILTILQRTGDPSSSQIVMFDASNMFYGDKIKPGTLVLTDLAPTGSSKSFNLTLRDNGLGNIYRADTPISGAATWNSVGNVLYEEGLMVIKSPHLSLFGKDHFKIQFEGERSVYVFEVSIPVSENLHNSSSNPGYKDLIPSTMSNEMAEKFTYITGVQLHDDNFNIIGRASLAQPFIKRETDRVVIKLRMDY
jgi:hypothetical protein